LSQGGGEYPTYNKKKDWSHLA